MNLPCDLFAGEAMYLEKTTPNSIGAAIHENVLVAVVWRVS